jgi:hypothetical protein
MSLAHLVDVHIHVTTNAKKGERKLEIRKNRHGRAGFEVPLAITAFGVEVGTPTMVGSLASARSGLEKACEKAIELLLSGQTLTGYDFDVAGVSAGIWRAGLEMGAKRLMRDGKEVECLKVNGRRGFKIKDVGVLPSGAVVIPFPLSSVPGEESEAAD